MDAIYKLYSNLYTSHQIKDADIFLEDIQVDGLTPELNKHCKGVITHSECQYVMDTMKTNTSPGLDGLTPLWYRHFWGLLRHFIVDVYNESFLNESITDSQKISVLALIHKKIDKSLLQNYRPICLTNCDYRILANVLANRLHKFLPYLISGDQTGYIKGRFIGQNIRIVEDIKIMQVAINQIV